MFYTDRVKNILCIAGGSICALLLFFIFWQIYKPDQKTSSGGTLNQLAQAVRIESDTLEITKSAKDIRLALEEVAAQIEKGVPQRTHLKVAVVDFVDLEGFVSDLSSYVGDRLSTLLSQYLKFSVVERQIFKNTLTKVNFNISDLADPDKARQVAKVLNIQALLMGTISTFDDELDLDIRLIDVNTNDTLVGVFTIVEKDERVALILERGRLKQGQKTIIAASTKKMLEFRFPQTIHTSELDFSLEFCEIEERHIECRITVANTGDKMRSVSINERSSYFLHVTGRQYPLEEVVAFGDTPATWRGGWHLPPDTRRALDLVFGTQGLPEDTQISSIVVDFRSYPRWRGFPDRSTIVFKRL